MQGYTFLTSLALGEPMTMFEDSPLSKSLKISKISYLGPGHEGRPSLSAETPAGFVVFYDIVGTRFETTTKRSVQSGDSLYQFLFTREDSDGSDIHVYNRIKLNQTVNHVSVDKVAVLNNDYGIGGTDMTLRQVIGLTALDLLAPGAAWIIGGSSTNDELFLGDGGGNMYGQSGDDYLQGGKGRDDITGDHGNDEIRGGGNNDTLYAGPGVDIVLGGNGNDEIDTGGGARMKGPADRAFGGKGQDTLHGGEQRDFMNGQDDRDTLYGNGGGDTLFGGGENDYLVGGLGRDKLNGGAGNDKIYVGTEVHLEDEEDRGLNTVIGGAGDDTIHAMTPGAVGDILSGNKGNDEFYVDRFDQVKDFSPGDKIHLLSGTDLAHISVSSDSGYTTIRFLNDALSLNTELTLDGEYKAKQFDFAPHFEGQFTTITLDGLETGGRAERKSAGKLFYDRAETLREGLTYPENYELVLSNFASWVTQKTAENTGTLARLAAEIGEQNAQRFLGVMGSIGYTFGQQLAGEFEGKNAGYVGLKYMTAAALGVVSTKAAAVAYSLSALSIIGERVVAWGIDAYFDSLFEEMKAEMVDPEASAIFQVDLIGDRFANTIYGTADSDTILGKGGDDLLFGDNGRDEIKGGPGNDAIYGGRGFDRLTGGPGRDSFFFDSEKGARITDFSPADDDIIFVFGSDEGLTIAPFKGGTRVEVNGTRVLLQGVDPEALQPHNIWFDTGG